LTLGEVMVRLVSLPLTFRTKKFLICQENSGEMRGEYDEFAEQMESIVFCVEV
jgi:hypothetical protein